MGRIITSELTRISQSQLKANYLIAFISLWFVLIAVTMVLQHCNPFPSCGPTNCPGLTVLWFPFALPWRVHNISALRLAGHLPGDWDQLRVVVPDLISKQIDFVVSSVYRAHSISSSPLASASFFRVFFNTIYFIILGIFKELELARSILMGPRSSRLISKPFRTIQSIEARKL